MLDLLLLNGKIIDPEKSSCFQANIGISDGRITMVADERKPAQREIDIKGSYISPGFIDIHIHENEIDENEIDEGEIDEGEINIETLKYAVQMGVTTAAAGNCGINLSGNSTVDYFVALNNINLPVNYLSYIGYGFLRDKIADGTEGGLSWDDFDKLIPYIEENLTGGACGVSLGLEYTPGVSTEEILWLGSFIKNNYPDKLLAAHYRFDAARSLEAVAEMIITSRETGVAFQVSHIGSCSAFGEMDSALKMLDAARKAGVDIAADVYPYDAFSTFIGSEVFAPGCFERWGKGPESLLVVNGPHRGEYCSKELFEKLRQESPQTLVAAFVMQEDEVDKAVLHPDIMIASDSLVTEKGGHPRASGTFPRYLAKYVREESKLDLPDAIRKITTLPAHRLGLENRGLVAPGYRADLTVFSLEDIQDNSTYQNPLVTPSGIEYVIVNGKIAVEDGRYQGGDCGEVISHGRT